MKSSKGTTERSSLRGWGCGGGGGGEASEGVELTLPYYILLNKLVWIFMVDDS